MEFYTVAEVAGIFRISKMTVYRMVNSGEVRSIEVGRTIRIPAEEVSRLRRGRQDASALS